jgi:adenine-specific DNA-methyltransferase
MAKIKKVDLKSMSIKDEQKEKLKQFFPEVFNEDKIDLEKLKLSLGENIDIGKERYGMNWPGKAQAIKVAQVPSDATLKPDEKSSVDFDKTQNLFIEGDNLEVLKLLQKSYFGKIKMIYIDPPYNTGKEFIYPDKYEEGLQTYLQYTGQIDAEGKKFSTNVETDGRFHSKWMNMMWPRLFLARNLLTEDGAIFVSIDNHELTNLRKICDEVFGEENNLGIISIVNNLKGRSDDEHIATANEFLLVYAKNEDLYEMRGFPLSEEGIAEYDLEDDYGKYKEIGFRKTGKGWRREDRPNMYYPIYFNITTGEISLEKKQNCLEILPLTKTGEDGRWRWGKDTFVENYKKNISIRKVRGGKYTIFTRMRLNIINEEERTLLPKTIWIDPKYDTAKGSKELKEIFGTSKDYFENPKPVLFLKDIIIISTEPDDYILDFFAGSATTAHAVMDLNLEDGSNRKFILTQLPEPTSEDSEAHKAGYKDITEIGKERIRRAGKKIIDESKDKEGFDAIKFDKGFKVFKLAKSNFSVWDSSNSQNMQKQLELHVDNIDHNSKDSDILYEILVKSGFELAEKIEEIKIEGRKVYTISDGKLLICLDKKLDKDFVRSLVKEKPQQFICLNSSFKEDADLTNTAKILENNQIEFRTI